MFVTHNDACFFYQAGCGRVLDHPKSERSPRFFFVIRVRVPRSRVCECLRHGRTLKYTVADTGPDAQADTDTDVDPLATPWHRTPSQATTSHAMTLELGRAHTMTCKYTVATRTETCSQTDTDVDSLATPRHTTPSQAMPNHVIVTPRVTAPHRIAT